MDTDLSSNTLSGDTPALIQELRDAFTARMKELYSVARRKAPGANAGPGHGASHMYHIDFPHGMLQVTAVYDAARDHFTQLVAREANEAHHERPSFTISLFL